MMEALLAVVWDNPAISGLIAAITGAIAVFVGLRLTKDRDAAVKQADIASGEAVWHQQVLDDNKDLRARLDAVEDKCQHQIDALKFENEALKSRVLELENGSRTR